MKILHISHGFLPEAGGGVERYLRDLLVAQRKAGHDARLVCGSFVPARPTMAEEVELDGIPVVRIHRDDLYFDHFANLYHPGVERILKDLFEQERPDVVHVHQWIRMTCNVVEIAASVGIPTVVTLHDLYTSCPRCFRVRKDGSNCLLPVSVENCAPCVPRFGHESELEVAASIRLYHREYQRELLQANVILTAVRATAEMVSSMTGFPRERIEVLPLARESSGAVRATASTSIPKPAPDVVRFGHFGNLSAVKGVPVLLHAFRALWAMDLPRSVELHLFGPFDTEQFGLEMVKLAGALPVMFHGPYTHADLEAADLSVAVFPSTCFETFGFVLDEAFALGLPTIVTDLGALSERASGAALRVPPNDVDALTSACARMVKEPDLHRQLGAAIPAVGLTMAGHVARLQDVYTRARAMPVVVDPASEARALERADLLLLQRESAKSRLPLDGGPR